MLSLRGLSIMAEWTFETKNPSDQFSAITDYLGKGDAVKEWTNKYETASFFTPTNSFSDFKSKDKLFLVGLRGSGKTAMMNMLDYEIQNKDQDEGYINQYLISTIIDQEAAYHELATNIQLSELKNLSANTLVFNIQKKWHWVIITSLMQAIVEKTKETGCLKFSQSEKKFIDKIENYLIDQDLINHNNANLRNPIKRVVKILSEESIKAQSDPTQVTACIMNVINRLYSIEFEDAKDALIQIIVRHSGFGLVMIDSIESYDMKDKVSSAIVVSLIDAALQFYNNSDHDRILIKVAFPLEIYSHLVPRNREKMIGRRTVIRWSHQDLVSLIAKRYWYFYNNSNHVDKELDNFGTALDFLYRHFPSTIITSNSGIKYDTLTYIFRHTQNKPRQVIIIFNSILSIAAIGRGYPPFRFEEDHVKRGIHAVSSELAISSLNMYEQLYPGFIDFIESSLANKPQCMSIRELEKILISGSSSTCTYLSIPEKKRLLFECGILGLDWSHKSPVVGKTIVESLFIYLTPENLPVAADSVIVIHPLYYTYLRTQLNINVSVRPLEYENS